MLMPYVTLASENSDAIYIEQAYRVAQKSKPLPNDQKIVLNRI